MSRRRYKWAFLPLPEAQLRQLTTARLLAYQRRLLGLHETSWDDIDQEDWRRRQREAGMIRYKDEPGYQLHRELLRRLLSEREHVERA